ncbi:MAG: hypothetical protein IT203_03985 [Fimbriimonadaceae bacterium]|nr:hypothetical protein [Fimbriimonadaceae bacterium]
MKKIFAILMVVSILGAMIGCSKAEEPAADGGTTPAAGTTGTEAPK